MIDLAIYYAKQRWPVFPLAAGAKVPAIRKENGGHGCLDATTNIETIARWWTEYPNANIGIATGGGRLVIDIDPRKTDKWLESVHSLALPSTFTVKTWSGGWHLYFSMPPGSPITIGADLLPGIDWRGNRGYVVAAGSIVEGRTYEIAKNLPIAPAPVALLERILRAKRSRPIERDASGHMVIPEKRRNDTLIRIGCALRRWGIGYSAILESLRAVNADHCEPALNDAELRQIAASAARYAPRGAA